jgi:hypothetical protein
MPLIPEDFQPSSCDLESVGYGDMEGGQFNVATKAGGEGFHHSPLEDRLSVIDDEGDDSYGDYRQHQCCGPNTPAKRSSAPSEYSDFCFSGHMLLRSFV